MTNTISKQKASKIDLTVVDQLERLGYKSPNAALKALLEKAPTPKGKIALMIEKDQTEKLIRLLNKFDDQNFKSFERSVSDGQLNYERIFAAFKHTHAQVQSLWGQVQNQTQAMNQLIDINNELNRLIVSLVKGIEAQDSKVAVAINQINETLSR